MGQQKPDRRIVIQACGLWGRALLVFAVSLLMIGSCATRQPQHVDDLCRIFEEKNGWYKAAQRSEERWGTPIHVQMAIIRQESTFKFDARPPRRTYLGFIPGPRPSTAYGYAQILDSTWDWYRQKTGNRRARRDNFADAIDFVGWYTQLTQQQLGVSKWDPYNQYLAYHEGHTGFKRKTYASKTWLKQAARSVDQRAKNWGTQLRACEDDLDQSWWWF